ALGLVRAAIILSQHLLKQIPAQAPTHAIHENESDVSANRLAYARSDVVGHATYADVDPKKMMTRIDRLVVLGIALTGLPLQWFFGERIAVLAATIFLSTAQFNMPLNWMVIFLLIL